MNPEATYVVNNNHCGNNSIKKVWNRVRKDYHPMKTNNCSDKQWLRSKALVLVQPAAITHACGFITSLFALAYHPAFDAGYPCAPCLAMPEEPVLKGFEAIIGKHTAENSKGMSTTSLSLLSPLSMQNRCSHGPSFSVFRVTPQLHCH